MNIFDDTYPVSGNHPKVGRHVDGWLSSTIRLLRRLGASWGEMRRRRRELGELSQFSDRELWDIGLSRSDILSIERKTYRRD